MPFLINGTQVTDFCHAYIRKAFNYVTTTAANGVTQIPVVPTPSLNKIDASALTTAIADCASFYAANATFMQGDNSFGNDANRGGDFYTSRNGVNNWPGDNSAKLHNAARQFGALTLVYNSGTSTYIWQ